MKILKKKKSREAFFMNFEIEHAKKAVMNYNCLFYNISTAMRELSTAVPLKIISSVDVG